MRPFEPESFRLSSVVRSREGAGNTSNVATRKKREAAGRYAAAGVLLRKALEDNDLSRKEFADRIEAEGGERTVTHWVLGDTWPRDPDIRARMRTVLREAVVDEIENEVAKVLRLPHVSAPERRVLAAYRDPAGMKAIDDAIRKWERSR